MRTWINDINVSVCPSVCPLGRLRLNKQLCLWSREEPQGSSVWWSISTHTPICSHVHTYTVPNALHSSSFTCPLVFSALLSLSPTLSLFLSWAPLLSVTLAHYKNKRNATPCDLSPTTRRGAGLDKRARGSCSHVPGPGRKHTDTNIHIQVVS